VDLVRCFNTLPRKPLFEALIRMGVPVRYITAWNMILQDMTRVLSIGRSCSKPSISFTGVPEGCGMSVVAMAAISWWAVQTVHNQHPCTNQICYADNWHILANTVGIFFVGPSERLKGLPTIFACRLPHKSRTFGLHDQKTVNP